MKARPGHRLLPLLLITAGFGTVAFPGNAMAAINRYWNPGGTGGDGIWGTSPGDKTWNITAGAATGNTVWPDTGNEVAVFQDAIGGTVTLFTPVQAAGIIQQNANYSIDAETLTLVPDNAAANPFIQVQTGTLTVSSTLDGSHGLIKSGSGNLVLTNSNTYTGTTSITTGTLTLTGSLASTTLDIAAGAALLDNSGGLADTTILTNSGNLTLGKADTVATYTQNGSGQLKGSNRLTTTDGATLNGGTITGILNGGNITSTGDVRVSGVIDGRILNISAGTLTNTGILGNAATHLNLTGGATLVASGTQSYALLTTSGPGSGTWQGDLTNPATIAPGGVGGIGSLRVTGNFSNTAGGVLKLDLATASHDSINITGSASLAGTLDLNQLNAVTPFITIQVVAAGSYAGNFAFLTTNFDNPVWFNPTDGTVMALASPGGSGNTLFGGTANQTSTWIALYDDVIAPGTTNVIHTPDTNPSYRITGGIASGNPDLLAALAASFTPFGLNTAVLNRLSPEVYISFQDYAIQATRSHQRAALDAPSLGWLSAPPASDSKSGSKNALPATPPPRKWEIFAALDYFNVQTNGSLNQANYQLSGTGFIAGTRTMLTDRIRLAGYVAANDGTADGTLLDADVTGWSLGLSADALLEERTHTLLSAGVAYGSYTFDGSRGSISATGAGWTPGLASFSGVDSDALELFIGLRSIAYHTESFRFMPSIGLRYAVGSMESFAEANGGLPGSPIGLAVDGDHYHSGLAELILRTELDVTRQLTLHGLLGVSVGLEESPAALNARFVNGSRPMRAEADSLSNDALILGLGATYQLRDSVSIGLNWRTDIRSGADPQNGVNLSTTFRF